MEISFIAVVALLAMGMLIWSCIEVGSNDATNLVNAVFGSRVLKRNIAIVIAGLFVVLGATFASPVMDTVRKGIFDTSMLTAEMSVSIFISAYLVGTILLYAYSAFGMPVSTTATLVFSLAGGAIGATGNLVAVNWPKMGQVTGAILLSIIISGVFAFLVQRIFRGAIRKDSQKHDLVVLHGPWITGLMMVSLVWFMIVKGMKYVPAIADLKATVVNEVGIEVLLFGLWALFTLFTHLALTLLGRRGTKYLFHFTAIIGMACMAFAFGQNDLANCASPGLASWMIWNEGLVQGSKLSISVWALFGCGVLMFLGMCTKRAQRVTRAEVNTASQQDHVNLYAPGWCTRIAQKILKKGPETAEIREIAPESTRNTEGKKLHYDALRASVILSVGACVISFASGLGLPVSTTYVAFAAVVATGWGDRVFTRGNSDLKLGRSIWVVTGWFMGAAISMFATGMMAFMIFRWQFLGLAIGILANIAARRYFKARGDIHELAYHKNEDILPKTNSKAFSTIPAPLCEN